ncbi:MAG: hypothetical protein KGJ88_11745 [Verrucomicrobiota bacterium]|nr:hypothetical protein [Verrucomicrobiota bacterium]
MSRFLVNGIKVSGAQCLVCERTISNDEWFARVKHGDLTVMLCSRRFAKTFYARRLPDLRRLVLLAAHPSLQWPRINASVEKAATVS